jgi:hypothetical protein
MGDMRPALEQALRALRVARVSALHPDSVSLYTDAITRAEAALEHKEQMFMCGGTVVRLSPEQAAALKEKNT